MSKILQNKDFVENAWTANLDLFVETSVPEAERLRPRLRCKKIPSLHPVCLLLLYSHFCEKCIKNRKCCNFYASLIYLVYPTLMQSVISVSRYRLCIVKVNTKLNALNNTFLCSKTSIMKSNKQYVVLMSQK